MSTVYVPRGLDGAYVIDRDSKAFGRVLNYLRDRASARADGVAVVDLTLQAELILPSAPEELQAVEAGRQRICSFRSWSQRAKQSRGGPQLRFARRSNLSLRRRGRPSGRRRPKSTVWLESKTAFVISSWGECQLSSECAKALDASSVAQLCCICEAAGVHEDDVRQTDTPIPNRRSSSWF